MMQQHARLPIGPSVIEEAERGCSAVIAHLKIIAQLASAGALRDDLGAGTGPLGTLPHIELRYAGFRALSE